MLADYAQIDFSWMLEYSFSGILTLYCFLLYPAAPVSAALSTTRQDLLVYTLSWPRLEVAAATQEAVTHNLTSAVLHQVSLSTAAMIVQDFDLF